MNHFSNVLCYVRPWSTGQFQAILEQLGKGATVTYCSEHRGIDNSGLVERYYSYLDGGLIDVDSFLTAVEKSEVIARCRLLRCLDATVALAHVDAMSYSVQKTFEDIEPSSFFCVTVDSYVLDIIRIYCSRNNVVFTGIIPTFVNGYFRVTAIGEANENIVTPVNNIDELKGMLLNQDYQPTFNAKSVAAPLRNAVLRWMRNVARVPYFKAKRMLGSDPYNYHHWSSELVAKANVTLFPKLYFGTTDWREVLARNVKPTIYIPLQMVPECTVDYWTQDVNYVDYYSTLQRLVAKFSKDFLIVIKEHPSVLGSRPKGFYHNLEINDDLLVVDTFVPSNQIVIATDAVLVWTGTVGFEAALRGKPVLCMATPYYFSGSRMLLLSDGTVATDIQRHIEAVSLEAITDSEQVAMLAHVQRQLYSGEFKNDGTWNAESPADYADSRAVSRSLGMDFP